MDKILTKLKNLEADDETLEWVINTDSKPEQLWSECKNPEWMLWLADRVLKNTRPLLFACCDIARSVLKYVPEGELRPLKAIEAAEAYLRGEVDLKIVEEARQTTNTVYWGTNAAIAAYLAGDVALAAKTQYVNSGIISRATRAAGNSPESRAEQDRISCDLIRKRVSWAMIEEGLAE